jgi:uncharacterized protein YjbJ (UPF0337 family)
MRPNGANNNKTGREDNRQAIGKTRDQARASDPDSINRDSNNAQASTPRMAPNNALRIEIMIRPANRRETEMASNNRNNSEWQFSERYDEDDAPMVNIKVTKQRRRSVDESSLKEDWAELKGKLKARFSRLSNENLESLKDNLDKLSEKLQATYGYAKDQADKEYRSFKAAIRKASEPKKTGNSKDRNRDYKSELSKPSTVRGPDHRNVN